MRMSSPIGALAVMAAVGLTATSALAASAVQKECSEKYQAAKAGGTLNGMTYNQYYKQCSADAKAEPAAATPAAAPAAATPAKPETKAEMKAEKKEEKKEEREKAKAEKDEKKKATTPTAAPAPAPAPAPMTTTAAKPAPMAPKTTATTGAAVFPTAISAQFSKETPGKARLHTCAAQYETNKAANGNGGLPWSEKGGGYYSECNKRLKG